MHAPAPGMACSQRKTLRTRGCLYWLVCFRICEDHAACVALLRSLYVVLIVRPRVVMSLIKAWHCAR
jgi:hypothetical protein